MDREGDHEEQQVQTQHLINDDLLDLIQQARANNNNPQFLRGKLIPALNAQPLSRELANAIVQTSSPSSHTIPWISALTSLISNQTSLNLPFANLLSIFFNSFNVEHAILMGGAFSKLIGTINSKADSTLQSSRSVSICITSALKRGVNNIDSHHFNLNQSAPLLSPIHSSLAYWSVLSKRYLFASSILNEETTYCKPDSRFNTTQLDVVQFHYYCSIILIAEEDYDRASQFLTIVMSIPITSANIDYQLEAYQKWICVSVLRSTRKRYDSGRISRLISEEDQSSLRKRCQLYIKFGKLFENDINSFSEIRQYVDDNESDFNTDGNLELALTCIDRYKEYYISRLQKKVFKSMGLNVLKSGFLDLNDDSSVLEYVNRLVLTGRISDDDYKVIQTKKNTFLCSVNDQVRISRLNKNLGLLIDKVVQCTKDIDMTSQDIIKSGEYSRVLEKSFTRVKLNSFHNELGGFDGVEVVGYDDYGVRIGSGSGGGATGRRRSEGGLVGRRRHETGGGHFANSRRRLLLSRSGVVPRPERQSAGSHADIARGDDSENEGDEQIRTENEIIQEEEEIHDEYDIDNEDEQDSFMEDELSEDASDEEMKN